MYEIRNLRAAVAVALLAGATGAQADFVDLKDAAVQPLVVTTSIYIIGGAFAGQVNGAQIGQYQIDQQSPATSFGAYCVDPFQLSSSGFQPYRRSTLVATDLPADQAVRFGEVTKLYANAYAGSLANATKSAGFQIALWEVWHDDENLATGNVVSSGYSDSASVAEAQGLLSSLSNWSATGAPALTLYHSDTYQDYVSPAPEPGVYVLLLAGFGVLGLARRRQA